MGGPSSFQGSGWTRNRYALSRGASTPHPLCSTDTTTDFASAMNASTPFVASYVRKPLAAVGSAPPSAPVRTRCALLDGRPFAHSSIPPRELVITPRCTSPAVAISRSKGSSDDARRRDLSPIDDESSTTRSTSTFVDFPGAPSGASTPASAPASVVGAAGRSVRSSRPRSALHPAERSSAATATRRTMGLTFTMWPRASRRTQTTRTSGAP